MQFDKHDFVILNKIVASNVLLSPTQQKALREAIEYIVESNKALMNLNALSERKIKFIGSEIDVLSKMVSMPALTTSDKKLISRTIDYIVKSSTALRHLNEFREFALINLNKSDVTEQKSNKCIYIILDKNNKVCFVARNPVKAIEHATKYNKDKTLTDYQPYIIEEWICH